MEEVCCNIAEFEDQALNILEPDVADYYQGGAAGEQTMRNNRKAFGKLRLRPRVMQDVSDRDSSLTVLGRRHRCPVGIAPSAMHKLAHCQGEVAMAKAAGEMDAIMILSILSTTSMEEVRQTNPETTLWMQLYIFKERHITLNLVRRAEAAGYNALVLTMDTAVLGSRYRDLKNKFAMPLYLTLENFRNMKQNDVDLSKFDTARGECMTEMTDYISTQFDDSVSWDDVKWLINSTNLPVICKGILTGTDANLCYKVGAKGIIVSNHGGRQLDHTPATIEALPEIVEAVGNKIEVYMDGGIRYGTDIFKAVGLGAKYVFVGRAALYGLAYSGWHGVAKVLQILNFEFDQTLALCGCNSAACITRDMIVHQKYYKDLLFRSHENNERSAKSLPSHDKQKRSSSSSNSESLKPCHKIAIRVEQCVDRYSNNKNTISRKNSPQRQQSEKSGIETPQQGCYSYKKTAGRKKSYCKQKSTEISPHRPKCFVYKKCGRSRSEQKYNKNSSQSQNCKNFEQQVHNSRSRNCSETPFEPQNYNKNSKTKKYNRTSHKKEDSSNIYNKYNENSPDQDNYCTRSNKYMENYSEEKNDNSNMCRKLIEKPPKIQKYMENYSEEKNDNSNMCRKLIEKPPKTQKYMENYSEEKNDNSNMCRKLIEKPPKTQKLKTNKYCENLPEELDEIKMNCIDTPNVQQGCNVGFCNSTCKTSSIDHGKSYKNPEKHTTSKIFNESSLCSSCNVHQQRHHEESRGHTQNNFEQEDSLQMCSGSSGNSTDDSSEDTLQQKPVNDRARKRSFL